MVFKKGEINNPAGGPPKTRRWSAAIERAIYRMNNDDPRALEKLAEKLVKEANKGDLGALKEIGDRIEGKSIQAVDHSGSIDGNITFMSGVPRCKSLPLDTNQETNSPLSTPEPKDGQP